MRNLFVIGDSISCYYGRYLQPLLAGLFNYDRKGGTNLLKDLDDGTDGVNGGHSGMVVTYLRERLGRGGFAPDVLLLNCGLHDIKKDGAGNYQVPPQKYEANLGEIIALSQKIGCQLAWVRTTPMNHDERSRAARAAVPADRLAVRDEEDVPRYNALADAVMRKAQVPLIDLYTFTLNLGADIYLTDADPVHFDKTAARLQAAFIAGAVSSIFP